MSACWASKVSRIALLLGVAGLLVAASALAAQRDSTRSVSGVRVSDEGIQFQGSGGADSATAAPDHVDATIDVGGQRVRIRGKVSDAHTGDPNIQVKGPVVVVDDEGDNVVRVFSDAEVPAGERVEGNVVAVFGSVTIRGQVAGDAISVFGTLRLEPGSIVDGDAVAVGGSLERSPSATVSGQSVAIEPGLGPGLANGLTPPEGVGVLLLLIAGFFVASLLFGMLWFPIAPDRMLRVAVTAAQRPFVSVLMGLVAGPLVFLLGLLALITVVGIPIAILLPFAWVLAQWAGTTAALQVVGCRLTRRPLSASPVGPYLAGGLFVTVLPLLGVAGLLLPSIFKPLGFFLLLVVVLLSTGIALMGTGAVLLSRFGSRPRDVSRRASDFGAAPEAPASGLGG
jgi:hypothetical protein